MHEGSIKLVCATMRLVEKSMVEILMLDNPEEFIEDLVDKMKLDLESHGVPLVPEVEEELRLVAKTCIEYCFSKLKY